MSHINSFLQLNPPVVDDYLLEYSKALLLKAKVTKRRILQAKPDLLPRKQELEMQLHQLDMLIAKEQEKIEKYEVVQSYVDMYDDLEREVKRLRKLKNRFE